MMMHLLNFALVQNKEDLISFGFRICPYWASAVRMFFRCCIF